MNWLSTHWQSLFGGVGGTALVALVGWFLRSRLYKPQPANLTTDSALASGSHISQRVNSPNVNVTLAPASADNSARAEKHLENIKARVVEPLDQWLNAVLCITRGFGDAVKFVAEPMAGTVGRQPVYRLEPVSIADAEEFSSTLFDDARKSHFPEQLQTFIPLRRDLEQLLADFASFANDCCHRLRNTTRLPRQSHENPFGPFANFEAMLAGSYRHWIIGQVPAFQKLLADSTGMVLVYSQAAGRDIAKDRADSVDAWLPAAVSLIQVSWTESGLEERFKSLARDANQAVASLEEIRLIEFLPGPCKYIHA